MRSFRENPDSEENQRLTRENKAAVFAAKMEHLTTTEIQMITYPARPVQGGSLTIAPPKSGEWWYEPKANGRRALLHLPSGQMWNRHGQRASLSAAQDFPKAFEQLLAAFPNETWLDCEILYGRIPLGKGSICVLDIITSNMKPTFTYAWRRHLMSTSLETTDLTSIEENSAFILPSLEQCYSIPLWENTIEANRILGHTMWEGVVAKKADSLYPIQTLSPKREYPFWTKHRHTL
jgi:hypothetical protein